MPERRPDWLPVARWEIHRLVRRPDFIISVAITPILVFGFGFLMSLFDHKGDRNVAVARRTAEGRWLRGAEALSRLTGYAWVDPGPSVSDTTALARGVRERAYEAGLLVRSDESGAWRVDLVTRRAPPRWTRDLREHLKVEARKERALRMGFTAHQLATLDDTVEVHSHVALGQRGGSRRGDFIVTFAILMLMMTVLLTSMSYLMVGISGEKQARVTEVVLSAIPAQAWMDGKIVAFSVIGLFTGVVWAISLVVLAGPLSFQLPGSVSPINLTVTTVFALLGLYFYNAFISGLMASAQNMQTASKWQSTFFLLPLFPLFFLGGLIDNPDSPAMAVLSQIPFFSPSMIPTRLMLGAVRPWEIALALVLLVLGCHLMRLFAGRVFRLGMLMYGKDMTLPELIRWARVK
jgi:ABC-2 type transport system permease protein